jgi:hypothetical protein
VRCDFASRAAEGVATVAEGKAIALRHYRQMLPWALPNRGFWVASLVA